MTLFAEYAPEAHGRAPPGDLDVRPATIADVPSLAALRVERGDAGPEAAREFFEYLLERARIGHARVLAATSRGTIAGYGALDFLARPPLPAGWYLGGVVVTPSMRRCGIGARLTKARLDWIAARASEAYYFVNERNRASIDLHATFGFREHTRDIRVPGIQFAGGVGHLFRVAFGPCETAT